MPSDETTLVQGVERQYPTTSVQRRIYLQCQVPGGDEAYHLIGGYRIHGLFNISAMEKFYQSQILRHEALRTGFKMIDGQLVAQVHENPGFSFQVIQAAEADVESIIKDCNRSFDLACPPLIRAVVICLDKTEFIMMTISHHLIFDGYSWGIISRETSKFMSGQKLAPLSHQYSDYMEMQTEYFQSREYETQKEFWLSQFETPPVRLDMLLDFPRPEIKSYEGKHRVLSMAPQKLRKAAKALNVTPYMILLAAYFTLWHRLTGKEDITIGTVYSAREPKVFADVVGMFANTLALRLYPSEKMPFTQFLDQVKELVLSSIRYGDFPFEHLVKALPFKEKGNLNPLFDVVLTHERMPEPNTGRSGFMAMETYDFKSRFSMFDMAVDIWEYNDQLLIDVEYCIAVYRDQTIEAVADIFVHIINQVLSDPGKTLGELSLLTEDAVQVPGQQSQSVEKIQEGKTILDLFRMQVRQNPDNPALSMNGIDYAFHRVNGLADAFARHLVEKGVQKGSVVAVGLERSCELAIAMVAIWKCEAVYLPLDVSQPRERNDYIVRDSRADMIVTHDRLKDLFAGSEVIVTAISSQFFNGLPAVIESCNPDISPDRIAYIIYTSGSTGRPKGVLIDHRALFLHIQTMIFTYHIQSDDNVLQFTSPAFDAAIEQMLVALCSGACLVFPDSGLNSPASVLELMADEEITIAEFPPAYLQALLDEAVFGEELDQVKLLISGGDVLSSPLAQETLSKLPETARLMNFYGPAEATMAATVYEVPRSFLDSGSGGNGTVPIGKPLANTRIYIVNAANEILPPGLRGEICIAGDRLAKGYLNRERLTREKFVALGLPDGRKGRVYKTGDLGRWDADGNIEFQGRMDHQIQLRGYRIELGEIEAVLVRHPDVDKAAVVLKDEDKGSLIAFLEVAEGKKDPDPDWRSYLKKRLPDYMLPSTFTCQKALPLTASGKIDRQALLGLETDSNRTHKAIPEDQVELELIQIWQQVLGISPIGIRDNFFELGGHSLAALEMAGLVQKKMAVELPVLAILQYPVLKDLARHIRKDALPSEWPSLLPMKAQGTRPPVFLMPGTNGNVFYMSELANCLKDGHPCYGLQPPYLLGDYQIISDIPLLAQFHLKEIQSLIQKELPCYCIGHSFSAYLAYEMIRQLETQDMAPALLVVLDTPAPDGQFTEPDMDVSERKKIAWAVMEMSGRRGEFWSEAEKSVTATVAELYTKAVAYLKSNYLVPAIVTEEKLKFYIHAYIARVKSFNAFRPESKIKTPILLCRAESQEEDYGFRKENGNWDAFTQKEVFVEWTPGDHIYMANPENAKALSDIINSKLT